MENIIKNNSLINMLYRIFGSMLIRIAGLFVKVKENRILMSSGRGEFIGDSPLLIYEELKNDPEFLNYEIVWAVNDVEKYKDDYNVIRMNTPKYFFYALSSKIWITSVNIERGLKFKKKETIYINTWHGIPLKHIGLDVRARKDYDFSHVDMFISSGDYENKIYRKAFNLSEDQLFTTGLPRNSKLEEVADKRDLISRNDILEKLAIGNSKDKTIIFFAPTWKDYDTKKLDLGKLCDGLGDSYTILFKSHPLELWNNTDSRIIDISHLDDATSIMKVSDILISDYSSIMIDYSILGRPIFAFVPDFDKYKSTRGLYIARDEIAPNTVVDEDDLIKQIKEIDYEEEAKKTKVYRDKFLEVNAKDSALNIIKELKIKLRGKKWKE